ncbi:hypothetical protein VV01_16330 [Luteipulveratus halotolerans]|uniref:Uncharacterized protein n=1 Tax=Luteipulveratus halotolerans TaxID=1631356 RepID=A0A0L6CLF2_9MICO|nr:hypothetical protein VV01_16330 [Luteipulveratus halotolerans]
MIAAASLSLLALAGCDSSPEQDPQALPSATVAPDRAKAPSGWITRQGAGFQVSVPKDWTNRPDDRRGNPGAELEIGPVYQGGSNIPPTFLAFVEREQVGPLETRESILRAQLQSQIPEAKIGSPTQIKVAGATTAVYFDLTYKSDAGTSVTGDKLAPQDMRQRELLIETPGLPKYGFRYNAPAKKFDEDTFKKIAGSIVVRPETASEAQGS